MGKGLDLKNYWPEYVLLVGVSVELLWKLGSGSLADWDEAIYAEIAWEILQDGDWLTLHWGYEPWFEKPPLLMWITASFYQIFGTNEFWARAASAVSGIALILITYGTGNRLLREKGGSAERRRAAQHAWLCILFPFRNHGHDADDGYFGVDLQLRPCRPR